MFCPFKTKTYAKWILSGEHAVLRGQPAIVFPLKAFYIDLVYEYTPTLNIFPKGKHKDILPELMYLILKEGHQLLLKPFSALKGHFFIENQIPLGQGLGGSAALCVALARWFQIQYGLEAYTFFEFSKSLEHVFHGQSSGLDIAGVSSAADPVYFEQGRSFNIETKVKPHWCLFSTNSVGETSSCIKKVNLFMEHYPKEAMCIDEQMKKSVLLAKKGLLENNILDLISAIHLGYDCFKRWGLISEPLEQAISFLKSQGALAVKPTGSGLGGYLIALWDNKPFSLMDNENASLIML